MKIKVCGMKYPENIREVSSLEPDYLGFIFYEKSPRYVGLELPQTDPGISRVGVFVNEDLERVKELILRHSLDAVQLHGDEDRIYCEALRNVFSRDQKVEVFKVIPVGESIDWDHVGSFEGACDFFLFDTLGKQRGGTGKRFDWDLLRGYSLKTPFILSGGIGLEDIENLKAFFRTEAGAHCAAIDVNSRFEKAPGLKDAEALKSFIQAIKEDYHE